MPRIRDLGISFIPETMRPPEIGLGGADLEYHAAKKPPTKKPPCDHYSKKPPKCEATKCDPSNALCDPSNYCGNSAGAPQCGAKSTRAAGAAALSDDAIDQLKQQLRHQVGAELPN